MATTTASKGTATTKAAEAAAAANGEGWKAMQPVIEFFEETLK